MAIKTGIAGSITVGMTTYPVTEWSVVASDDLQDITDTSSDGWQVQLSSIKSAEATFKAFYGSTAGLASAFAIGSTVTASFAIGNTGDSVDGDFVIKSFTITNNYRTPIEFMCTASSTGEITF